MAVILVLAGGLFGFASAIASLIVLNASLLLALAIWSGSGLAVLALGLTIALLTRPVRSSEAKIASGARTI